MICHDPLFWRPDRTVTPHAAEYSVLQQVVLAPRDVVLYACVRSVAGANRIIILDPV